MANITERRVKRLSELKCPIHGQTMIKEQITDTISGNTLVHFTCNQSQCEIAGTAVSLSGPIQLADEFTVLLDSTIGQLPIQTLNQQRGIRAADVAALALSRIAFVHRVDTGTDIGIDFICELRSGGKPTGRLFNVQCKALPITFDGEDDFIDFDIKVSTARYWLEQASPTVMLVPDPDTGRIYWTAPLDPLRAKQGDWRLQETVTVKVQASTGFDCFAEFPTDLAKIAAQGIKSAGSALSERLYAVRQAIKSTKREGVNRESKLLSPSLLADDSPMSEARETLASLLHLQKEFVDELIPIIDEFCGILWKIAEDVCRRTHAIAGRPSDWKDDPDYLRATAKVNRAWTFIRSQPKNGVALDMGELLEVLRDVEELHQNLLESERLNEELELEREQEYALSSNYISDTYSE